MLSTNKYGLPVHRSSSYVDDEEDPFDAYMREIDQQAKSEFQKSEETQ